MSSDRLRVRGSEGDGRPGRILVAEREPTLRESLASLLRNAGHIVELTERPLDAPDRALRGMIDVIVLSFGAASDGGLEACRLVKAATGSGFVPVLVLSGQDDVQSRVLALRSGADDCLSRPFDGTELLLRLGALLRTRRAFAELGRRRAELEASSLVDEATGLPNQRAFLARLTEEWKRADRHKEPLSCAFVEVDRARAGDAGRVDSATLRTVASTLRKSLREMDFVARGRADELLVLLPATHFTGAAIACDRIARRVRDLTSDEAGRSLRCTVAIGVALFPSRDASTKEALLRAAEGAAARARAEGGDTVFLLQHQGYVYAPSPEPRGDGDRDSAPASLRFGADATRTEASAPPSSRFESAANGPPSSRLDTSASGPASARFDSSASGPSSSRLDASGSGPPSSRVGGARRPSS
jgi:two-component system cell cycle response regulator